MGKKKVVAWKAPADDETIALRRFTAQDPQDPRVLGEGPCRNQHVLEILETFGQAPEEQSSQEWGEHQHCRWVSCPRCALRLAYWSKKESSGHFRQPPLDHAKVRQALQGLKSK